MRTIGEKDAYLVSAIELPADSVEVVVEHLLSFRFQLNILSFRKESCNLQALASNKMCSVLNLEIKENCE